MDKKATILTITLLFCLCGLFAQQSQSRIHYIDKYKQIAVDEMHRTGIPASIKLAQAILESAGGTSVLAKKANNHFGIKCGYAWTGKTMYRMDDDFDDKGNPIESCFRAYKNPESSFIAHSEFLTNRGKRSRYNFLFDYEVEDYKNWAKGLKKAGYATNPKYPQMLISIIETYELNIFDATMPMEHAPPLAEAKAKTESKQPSRDSRKNHSRIIKINDVDMTYAMSGETPESISNRADIPVKRILKYNDELYDPYQDVKADYRVFLQPKRGSFRGKQKNHKVKRGETMMDISQKYGIRLDRLYTRNKMAVHTEPLVGALIKIKGFKIKEDKTPSVRQGIKTLPKNDEEFFDEEVIATAIEDFEKPKMSLEGRPFSGENLEMEEKSPKPLQKVDVPQTKTIVMQESVGTIIPASAEAVILAPKTPVVSNTRISDTKRLHYTVKRGDTLYRISKKFGRSVTEIKEKNALVSNHLNIGQILIVN